MIRKGLLLDMEKEMRRTNITPRAMTIVVLHIVTIDYCGYGKR